MLDLNLHHDPDQDQHTYLFSPKLQSSSSSSSHSNPIFLMTPSHHQPLTAGLGASSDFSMESHRQQEVYKVETGWDQNHPSALVNDHQPHSDKGLKFKIRRREDSNEYETNNSVKWMSSKMRIMRKMINSDRLTVVDPPTPKLEDHNQQKPSSPVETDNSSNSSSNNSARVCADCNTTKTPLWRSGPRGPKTLCNACGIRQRKARRAMAAAAAATNGTSTLPASNPPPMKKGPHKNKRSSTSGPELKKRFKIINSVPSSASSRKKICFEDLRSSLSKSSAFQQVFPQDEKEAAILLMALSYGMVHG